MRTVRFYKTRRPQRVSATMPSSATKKRKQRTPLRCAASHNQIEIAALKTQLEAVTQRLERLENQRTSIPPMCQHLTSAPPRPSCGRRLFVSPDSDECNAEQTISHAFLTSTPDCPRSLNLKKSTQLPDVPLRSLTAEREETIYKECFQRGEHRPDVYAANVFMALSPFEAYQSWAKQVNWSGTNGKAKLPKNLKDKVHEFVIQRFPDLTADHWFRVRSKINERLRSPRKLDPEQQRAGFSNNL